MEEVPRCEEPGANPVDLPFRREKGLREISNLDGIRGVQSLDPSALQIEFRVSHPGVLSDLAETILQIDKLQASSEKSRSPVTEQGTPEH